MWRRVLDTNDRYLRKIQTGLSKTESKINYQPVTGFDISVASEIMAVLGLSKDLRDLKERLERMIIGYTKSNEEEGTGIEPIYVEDLGLEGALLLLLRDAFMPNLIQSLEHSPVLVHTGPFANIAHGNSSVVADMLALRLTAPGDMAETKNVEAAGFVVTEAGFGADIGLEKFMNIKLRPNIHTFLKTPDLIVLCVTIRQLKMHGGAPKVVAGKILGKEYLEERVDLVQAGLDLLRHHIHLVINEFGIICVVAINRFR